MRKLGIITCALIIAVSSTAHANDPILETIPNVQEVGQGRLSYLIWDVYDAKLFAPDGVWKNDQPYALELSYLMDIEGKKIADRSASEIRELGLADEIQLAAWHAQMCKIFPSVKTGDTITGVLTKDKQTIFYKNDIEIGQIKDAEFSNAFFGIWLDKNTNAPDLRLKLLNSKNSKLAGY